MTLTTQQIRKLRSLAHHLKPVVMIGDKGINDNILTELDRALEHHELIKVTIAGASKDERRALTDELCQASNAILVQLIGRISILYRPSKEAKQNIL
jgi:RNA-binding protein